MTNVYDWIRVTEIDPCDCVLPNFEYDEDLGMYICFDCGGEV